MLNFSSIFFDSSNFLYRTQEGKAYTENKCNIHLGRRNICNQAYFIWFNSADHETTVSAERMWTALKNSSLSSRKCSKLDISGVPETGT